MNIPLERHRVLIIEDEVGVRHLVQTLLASMGYRSFAVSSGREALALIRKENFDAVLLDRQCLDPSAEEVIAAIEAIRPELLERMLILTDQGTEGQNTGFLESHSLPSVPRRRLLQEFCPSLQALFQTPPAFPPITHRAQMVFNSVHEPVPAGVRAAAGALARQIIYAHGSVNVDLQVVSEPGSKRIWLVGQIADSAKPDRKIDNVPVMAAGPNGSLAHTTTNQFGEFLLEFRFEVNAQLNIRISERHVILVSLQDLEPIKGQQPGSKAARA